MDRNEEEEEEEEEDEDGSYKGREEEPHSVHSVHESMRADLCPRSVSVIGDRGRQLPGVARGTKSS